MPLFSHKFRHNLSVSGCIVGSYAFGFYISFYKYFFMQRLQTFDDVLILSCH